MKRRREAEGRDLQWQSLKRHQPGVCQKSRSHTLVASARLDLCRTRAKTHLKADPKIDVPTLLLLRNFIDIYTHLYTLIYLWAHKRIYKYKFNI